MVKFLSNTGIEGKVPSLENKILFNNDKRMNAFFIRTRQEYPLWPVQCTNYAGISTYNKKARKRNKRNTYWKERKKLCLFEDDMIVHIENPKDKNILEIISNVARYKINIKNQLYFYMLVTSNRKFKFKTQYHLK